MKMNDRVNKGTEKLVTEYVNTVASHLLEDGLSMVEYANIAYWQEQYFDAKDRGLTQKVIGGNSISIHMLAGLAEETGIGILCRLAAGATCTESRLNNRRIIGSNLGGALIQIFEAFELKETISVIKEKSEKTKKRGPVILPKPTRDLSHLVEISNNTTVYTLSAEYGLQLHYTPSTDVYELVIAQEQ